jgi:protocatechuate 3,4-dioxygenase, beta subunit
MDEPRLGNRSRRHFIVRAAMFAAVLPAGCRAAATGSDRAAGERVGGPCEGCEAIFEGMPEKLAARTRIAAEGEAGEPMEIGGVVYRADGKTPAKDVILYVYHTDAAGIYAPAPGATGNARRHGHLRGWMRTDAAGAYHFTTIRPASYPGGGNPAHVHAIVKEPGVNEYWIDDFHFEGDRYLPAEAVARMQNRGGSGVLALTKREGVWVGRRDIVLGLNVPNYGQ